MAGFKIKNRKGAGSCRDDHELSRRQPASPLSERTSSDRASSVINCLHCFGLLSRSHAIMLRWVILCVVVVALAATATLVVQYGTGPSPTWNLPASVKPEGPQPRVEVEGPLTYEFGELSTQKTTTRKWKVKNTGEGDLEIWLGSSTCTCTIPKLKGEGTREVIKPGDSTEVELEWKTRDSVGEFGKGATILTNDMNRPEFMLKVHGMVHAPIVVLPEPREGVVLVGDVATDKGQEVSLALFSSEHP